MTTPRKPLPNVNDRRTAPFWAASREHQLKMQKCPACGYVRWPAAKHCPECLQENDEWVALSGRGRVWSFGIYNHLFNAAFADDMPYDVALVQLDEGPQMYTNIVGIDPELLVPDMRVEAVFDDVTPEVTLVKFRPAT